MTFFLENEEGIKKLVNRVIPEWLGIKLVIQY